jgi:hypothetical protein
MNIVKSIKAGSCAVMRCQSPEVALVDGAPFGRPDLGIPLCQRHYKESLTDVTQAPLPASTAPAVVAPAPSAELALVPQNVKAEVEVEGRAAHEALSEIEAFVISSDEDLAFAAEVLTEVKGNYARLEERKKQATDPLNSALRTIRDWFRPAQDFYAKAETTLKGKIADYHKRRNDERQAALLAAAAAHQSGDGQGTQAALAAVPPPPPKVDGVSVREDWTYEITDFGAVPDKFKAINHALLLAVVKESKGNTNIPGVRAVPVNKVVARAG